VFYFACPCSEWCHSVQLQHWCFFLMCLCQVSWRPRTGITRILDLNRTTSTSRSDNRTVRLTAMHIPVWHDTVEDFNVDSKAEYSAYLAHIARKTNYNKQPQCPFDTVQVKIREGSLEGIRVTIEERICEKEMSFKSGLKGRGSDRWWERRWWLWWGDMCRMRWTRRRGTAAAAPPPLRPGKPALCGSRPLVTPYYCRLGDLLCYIFVFF